METLKTITLTASQLVDDFTSLEEVEFSDIKDSAEKMAKKLPRDPHVQVDNKFFLKKVTGIDFNKPEMKATINYILVDDTENLTFVVQSIITK